MKQTLIVISLLLSLLPCVKGQTEGQTSVSNGSEESARRRVASLRAKLPDYRGPSEWKGHSALLTFDAGDRLVAYSGALLATGSKSDVVLLWSVESKIKS